MVVCMVARTFLEATIVIVNWATQKIRMVNVNLRVVLLASGLITLPSLLDPSEPFNPTFQVSLRNLVKPNPATIFLTFWVIHVALAKRPLHNTEQSITICGMEVLNVPLGLSLFYTSKLVLILVRIPRLLMH